jgi:hypothetical protein
VTLEPAEKGPGASGRNWFARIWDKIKKHLEPTDEGPPISDKRLARIFKFMGWSGAAAVIGVASPWLQPLLNVGLISELHQRTLNPFASLLALIAFLVCYVWFKPDKKERQKALLVCPFGVGFIVIFLYCLVLTLTVGEVWDPEFPWDRVLTVVWFVLYLALFVFVGGFLSLMAMLVVGKR